MRRRFAILSLFFAWLCANGAVWDVAQVFAWSRMFTGYAQSLSMSDALRETFDGNKPCALCQAIAKAKTTEQKQAPVQIEQSAGKLVLTLESPTQVFLIPPSVDWPRARIAMIDPRVEPVPLPPPRA